MLDAGFELAIGLIFSTSGAENQPL